MDDLKRGRGDLIMALSYNTVQYSIVPYCIFFWEESLPSWSSWLRAVHTAKY